MTPSHGRQAPFERRVRRRRLPGFLQHPQAVQLAGRLDDPCQHQLAEHLIARGGPAEAEHVIAAAQGIQQVLHPRGRDRQRPARAPPAEAGPEVQLALPGRQALPRDGLEDLQFGVVVGRADVLDVP
jgi:hypothetical protein